MKPDRRPPPLANRIFTWYCGAAQVDDLLGDMDEIFRRNLDRMPAWRAKLKYWRQVFSLMVSYAIRKRRQRASLHPHSNNSINLHMLKNYFLIAWRMMVRNQVYTIINVLGLTLGISACIVVYLVVDHELSFDRFHPDKERIFRLTTLNKEDKYHGDAVPAPAYLAVRDEYAGAEAITGYHTYDAKAMIEDQGNQKLFARNTVNVIFTNPDYFKIFQYQWLAGDARALAKPFTAVLTENRARTYFGSIDLQQVIGKTITYNDSISVSVAGVVKDWEHNSDFTHTEFISFSTIETTALRKAFNLDNWGIILNSSQSFVKLKPGDELQEVTAQLDKIVAKHFDKNTTFNLQPLTDIHFNTDAQGHSTLRSTLFTLGGLAAFILVIAAINFINLSTAQSIGRAREIGIRKVMGSIKTQIVVQFLSETIVLAFVALCLSLALTKPLLMLFGDFIPGGLSFDPLSMNNWLFMGGLLLVISLIAGTYPALVMSSYLPAVVLRAHKSLRGREKFSLRKTLIVFQFAASLFFIIAALVINNQMDFIRKTDRGFSTAGVLTFTTNGTDVSKVETLTNKLRNIPGLDDVTMQFFPPMGFALWRTSFEYSGKGGSLDGITSVKPGDDHYLTVYKLRLAAGRNLQPSDTLKEIMINDSFAKALGFDDPQDAIGEQVKINGNLLPICGVVEDFHELSFREPIANCVIGNFRNEERSIAVRLPSPDVLANADAIQKIESEFKQVYPDESFQYHFIEDEIAWMHNEEKKTSNLATIAMFITIFISCMGVFGLAMFTAAMRTKEIGIRKVLGATSINIVNMLSREFMILILLAIVVATPVAWYYMNNWLLGFTYREDLKWTFFASAAGIALLTGLITVCAQSLKAALADPAAALRTE